LKPGSGIINKSINTLPFEADIPGYNFCEPGTKLKQRLERGDRGINQFNEACRVHDIAYSQYKDLKGVVVVVVLTEYTQKQMRSFI